MYAYLADKMTNVSTSLVRRTRSQMAITLTYGDHISKHTTHELGYLICFVKTELSKEYNNSNKPKQAFTKGPEINTFYSIHKFHIS